MNSITDGLILIWPARCISHRHEDDPAMSGAVTFPDHNRLITECPRAPRGCRPLTAATGVQAHHGTSIAAGPDANEGSVCRGRCETGSRLLAGRIVVEVFGGNRRS